MKIKDFTYKLAVPEGIQVTVSGKTMIIKGPKGELSRDFINPKVMITTEGSEIVFKIPNYSKKEKAVLGTYKAHIKNTFRGLTEGHEYLLKICSGHFPMNVECKGDKFQVKNFFGEKVPRVLKIREGVDVKVEGDKITANGIAKEDVAQTAADIEQLTRRSGFDKRVFQDGIYIVNKDGKKIKS